MTTMQVYPILILELAVPTAGKLDPRWEGEWVVKTIKSPVNVEITDGKRTKVVHTNRLQHHYIPCIKFSCYSFHVNLYH